VSALAPAVAWFYDEPRLSGITLLLATNFFFAGVGVQHRALLERQMRFGLLVAIDVLATLGGIAVAITLALRGAGYSALVFGSVATAALTALLAWILSGWRPGFPSKVSGLGSLLSFGGHLAAFAVVNYWSRNLDNVLIGWRWGAPAVALYDQAYKLLLLPINMINWPVSRVMIPALSHLRHDGEKWARTYYRALMGVMLIGAPVSTFCFVFADVVIGVVLGQQWAEAVPIFRYLAISGIAQSLCNTSGWIYISNGRTDRMFRMGLIGSAVVCAGFLVAVPYGATGVAIAYSALTLGGAVPLMAYACHGTPIKLGRLLAVASPATVASVAAAASAYAAREFAGPDGPYGIALAMPAFLFTYLALVLPWAGPRDTIGLVLRKLVTTTTGP
jgi:O-antigen/teichoic acid export membrane protein